MLALRYLPGDSRKQRTFSTHRIFSTVRRPAYCHFLWAILLFVTASPALLSQQKIPVLGDYEGVLGTLHVKLHIVANPDGTLSGTFDSPNQGVSGIPCADVHLDGTNLGFLVPTIHGSWKGSVQEGGKQLAGTWNQGNSLPLIFTRDTFVPASKASLVDGIWLGTLDAGAQSLRIQVQVKSDNAGREFCTVDSLDQHAFGLDCTNAKFSGNSFSFDVPSVHGHWTGQLSGEGDLLTGTWEQGRSFPLRFKRQIAALGAPPVTFDSAMPPVEIAELQSVLQRDLEQALKDGALAPGTGAGVTVGVVEHGVRRVFTFGAAKPDSLFEIGSISKTFTGLILSQMVLQNKVQLNEPVRNLLPPGTVVKPTGTEITLLDLATQHSGLPRMPDNFHPADPQNPYADYHAADLYAYIAKHGVGKPADASFLYSNLGLGLLGQALANCAEISYPRLLKEEVTGPLGMKDTVVSLSPEQQSRFIQGHDAQHRPAHAWDLDALAGAGAIRSTASDMLTYLEAHLHPEKLSWGGSVGTSSSSTLARAITQSHVLRADVAPTMRIGLAWFYDSETGNYWHNGGTGGYSSYAFFNPEGDYAAVVLFNTSPSAGDFMDKLGQHIYQRLAGKPAISLAN